MTDAGLDSSSPPDAGLDAYSAPGSTVLFWGGGSLTKVAQTLDRRGVIVVSGAAPILRPPGAPEQRPVYVVGHPSDDVSPTPGLLLYEYQLGPDPRLVSERVMTEDGARVSPDAIFALRNPGETVDDLIVGVFGTDVAQLLPATAEFVRRTPMTHTPARTPFSPIALTLVPPEAFGLPAGDPIFAALDDDGSISAAPLGTFHFETLPSVSPPVSCETREPVIGNHFITARWMQPGAVGYFPAVIRGDEAFILVLAGDFCLVGPFRIETMVTPGTGGEPFAPRVAFPFYAPDLFASDVILMARDPM
jgi:hypothetical protein